MKASYLSLALPLIFLSTTSLADNKPWLNMTGDYTVNPQCKIDFETGFDRGQIEVSSNGKILTLKAFTRGNSATIAIPLRSFSEKAQGTDGDVFYALEEVTQDSLTATRHFVREGSDTWPDLERLETFSLAWENGDLLFSHMVQSSREPLTKTIHSCRFSPIEENSQNLIGKTISRFSQKNLEQLAKYADSAARAGMDLDQSDFQIAKMKLNKINPRKDEVQGLLSLTPGLEGDITIKNPSRATPESLAETALKTVLGFAGQKINSSEYRTLRTLRSNLIQFLTTNRSELNVLLIEWKNPDADGEGILLIDKESSEAFYLGSGFFS